MTKNSTLFFLCYLPVSLFLLGLRWHLVGQAGFPDYDSVRNWEIVQELANGNFQNMFHHRSPGFYLIYLPFSYFFTDFHSYIYLNAVLGVFGLVLLTNFLKTIFNLSVPEAGLLLAFCGSSLFLTFSGRFFTIESPSLLIFALVLQQYYGRFRHHSRKLLFQTLGLLALGLSINYKFLLLLPIAAVLEFLFRDGLVNLRTILLATLILLSPYLIFGVFSVLVGLPFYLFPANYSGMVNFTAENPAHRSGKFRTDFFYYFQYLFNFESPLTWLGLLSFPVVFRRQLSDKFNAYNFLGIICYAFLIGMSLLLKAPRGLLFIYPLLYFLGFLVLKHTFPAKRIFSALVICLIGFNVYHIYQEIYRYVPTSYGQMAAFLKQHQVRKVAGTVSLGLKPYLPADVEYRVIMNEKELPALKQEGFRYLLLDDYRKVTNVKEFRVLEKQKPIIRFREPAWESPLIFLEHSEFTGLGFKETLKLREQALQDSLQLQLLKLP